MGNTPCVSFRFDPEDLALLEQLKSRYGLSRTGIVRLAIRRLSEELRPASRDARKPRKKSGVSA